MVPETSSFLSQMKTMWPSHVTRCWQPSAPCLFTCAPLLSTTSFVQPCLPKLWNREEEADKGGQGTCSCEGSFLMKSSTVPLNGKSGLLGCCGWSHLRYGRKSEGPRLIWWCSSSNSLFLHLKNTHKEKKFSEFLLTYKIFDVAT